MTVYIDKPIKSIRETDYSVLVLIRMMKNSISQLVNESSYTESKVKCAIRLYRKLGYITPVGIYLTEAGQVMISAYLTQRSLAERQANQSKDVDKFLTNGTQ